MGRNTKLSLTARSFDIYKQELQNYIKGTYPELEKSFLDNSIGQVLLELNAGVADSLNYYIDKAANENFEQFAQQESSLYQLAKNKGIKLPNKAASIVVCDFTVSVPVSGDTYNVEYLPLVKTGTQVIGNGVVFEVDEDIDFSSSLSINGLPNRTIVPILNATNNIIRYDITKREVLRNGISKQFKTIVNQSTDFYSIILPETDVLSVEQIAVLNSTNSPDLLDISDFFGENRWWEVDSLSQTQVFQKIGARQEDGLFLGKWVNIEQKFISEFTSNNFMRITFGNGEGINNDFKNVLKDSNLAYNITQGLLKNNSLGKKIPINSSVFVRYKIGGGANTNVPAGTLKTLGRQEIEVFGTNPIQNENTKRSLQVNNPIPALGGRDKYTIEEIRNFIKYSLGSRKRCVTLDDYRFQLAMMDGKFGRPFKTKVFENNNKIVVSVLGIDSTGKLTEQITDSLKTNIKQYLSNYKMINDYVEVTSNKVINIGVEVEALINNDNDITQIVRNINSIVKDFFDPTLIEVDEDLHVGKLYSDLYTISGLLNVIGLKFYNIVDTTGIKYSTHPTTMSYVDNNDIPNTTQYKKQIDLQQNTLYANKDEIFELRYPETDVTVILRKMR